MATERVARITLVRTEVANAQDTDLLYALNDAFDRAAHDDEVRVIVLDAEGKHFSSGHDLAEQDTAEHTRAHRTVGTMCGFGCAGAEAQMAREEEIYVGFSERWRNIPKPTIAAVQGKCVAGGLMLAWPCDLIIASDDASFSDPTVSFGVNGVEYFVHALELGTRKAKELLFTSEPISAQDAFALGMVNRVVPREELHDAAIALATQISAKSRFALKLSKLAVNAAEDAQGRVAAIQNAFALHQLGHTHWLSIYGVMGDPTGMPQATLRASRWDRTGQRLDGPSPDTGVTNADG
jgi:enoyl-CoA hydratase